MHTCSMIQTDWCKVTFSPLLKQCHSNTSTAIIVYAASGCLQVAFYLIDLLQDTNVEIVKAADQALSVISNFDEEWAARLRALKFEAHNQAWLEACANGSTQLVSTHNFPLQNTISVKLIAPNAAHNW